jgi:hypothetical protein
VIPGSRATSVENGDAISSPTNSCGWLVLVIRRVIEAIYTLDADVITVAKASQTTVFVADAVNSKHT